MGTPKGDTEDETPHENFEQRHDPDADGSNVDADRGDTLSALTAETYNEKELQSDSKEQATKSDEKGGLAITALEKVSTDKGQVNHSSGGHSSMSDHHKGPLSSNNEIGPDNLQGGIDHSGKDAETSKILMSLPSGDSLERGPSSVTSIHATGPDSKVGPLGKEAKEDSNGLEQRQNHAAKNPCGGGAIVTIKSEAGDTLPQIQTPNSSPNMTLKFEAGSDSLSFIQTPNVVLPSSQSDQEKFDFSVRSEKSLDKLQPRRNPETCIHAVHSPSVTPEKPSDDGFNWRKYGQKFVKGNEFVRSYYRCTYLNCFAKKQVERSNAGQITDINYIGEHEHPRPQHMPQVGIAVVQTPPTRKPELSVVSSPKGVTDIQSRPLLMIKPESPIVSSPKAEKSSASHSVVSQSIVSKKDAPSSSLAKYSLGRFTRDEFDNTSGPDMKRLKLDISSSNDPGLDKHSGEPRQVVQTMSEVDLVSDGYRWRKYGQKIVKGNPNPRSYYRCSNAGCPVKKHVERASHDPKLVITTYEGQHGHEMPFTRTVMRNTSGGPGTASVDGEPRSSETGENKTNGLEMVVHISAN